jgi:large subunit ribosomal protein L21
MVFSWTGTPPFSEVVVYALIRAGGKQHKVAKGDVIEIEHLRDGSKKLEFTPLLVVDDKGKATSEKSELAKAKVKASVLGESKGAKVDVFKYRSKTGYRRQAGHRQRYTSIQIDDIAVAGGKAKQAAKKTTARKTSAPKKTTTRKSTSRGTAKKKS